MGPINMRTVAGLILVTLIIDISLAVKFTGVEIKLGKRSCTCDFTVVPKDPCTAKAKCDKKCSGKGQVEVEGYEMEMKCSKGKCAVSSCQDGGAATEVPTGSGSEPGSGPTGSGATPLPITGSGSGATPLPITGSGSGEEPVPITGTGSGSGMPPMPPTGESMPCSCQCSCPEGGAACDCDCNCPVRSPMIYCDSGFTKVCPMMEGEMCPDMMMAVCPDMMMPMPMPATRMSHGGEGCQCVPDFLLAIVPGMPAPGTPVAGRSASVSNRAAVTIPFGKKKCKCEVDCRCMKGSCAKSKITCDKKCSGTAKKVPIDGCGVVDAKAAKGKVKISKCTCGGEEPGSGSGPTEPTGSGSGPTEPITGPGPTGSGSGSGPMPMPRCACVGMM